MLSGVVEAACLKYVVGTESHAVDPVSVSFKVVGQHAGFGVPNFDGSVLASSINGAFATP